MSSTLWEKVWQVFLTTPCTVSDATVDLLPLFHNAELLAKELLLTPLDVEEDDRNLSASLLAIRLRVCAAHLYCGGSSYYTWVRSSSIFVSSESTISNSSTFSKKWILFCFFYWVLYRCRIIRIWIDALTKLDPLSVMVALTFPVRLYVASMNLLYLASQDIICMLPHHSCTCYGCFASL